MALKGGMDAIGKQLIFRPWNLHNIPQRPDQKMARHPAFSF
ncbi:hypothetical protein [Curvibacter gracilis]|nr:hypothetical protein [Curvibacter gracilis]